MLGRSMDSGRDGSDSPGRAEEFEAVEEALFGSDDEDGGGDGTAAS